MIPRIIHYTWLGGSMPDEIRHNIESWKILLPDYQFMAWDERNWNVSQSEFTETMYKRKKYSFVADVIRVDVLARFGGIYLDTDVHVNMKFDSLLGESLVLGRLYNNAIGTAVIMAQEKHPLMKYMQQMYAGLTPDVFDNPEFDLVNNGIFTRYFLHRDLDFHFGNKIQRLKDGTLILPKQSFEITAFPFEKNIFATHEAMGSWRDDVSNHTLSSIVRLFAQKIVPHPIRARAFNWYCGKKNSIAKEYGPKR